MFLFVFILVILLLGFVLCDKFYYSFFTHFIFLLYINLCMSIFFVLNGLILRDLVWFNSHYLFTKYSCSQQQILISLKFSVSTSG